MIKQSEITNWDFNDLIQFLDSFVSTENNFYEFKENYRIRPEKIRKFFSSFANSEGGYIFFGIDNEKNIIGLEVDDEINTKLNQKLSCESLQPPLDKWYQINRISIPETLPEKVVYIFCIESSISINKPHLSDSKIFVRENGESNPIKSGRILREKFFMTRFQPEHIKQLEFEMRKIKNYKYEASEIDAMYFRDLGEYLEKSIEEETDLYEDLNNLLEQYNQITSLITDIEAIRAELHSSTGVPPIGNPIEIEEKYDNLRELIEKFLHGFKEVHQL